MIQEVYWQCNDFIIRFGAQIIQGILSFRGKSIMNSTSLDKTL